jgi:hypothetical protein
MIGSSGGIWIVSQVLCCPIFMLMGGTGETINTLECWMW